VAGSEEAAQPTTDLASANNGTEQAIGVSAAIARVASRVGQGWKPLSCFAAVRSSKPGN